MKSIQTKPGRKSMIYKMGINFIGRIGIFFIFVFGVLQCTGQTSGSQNTVGSTACMVPSGQQVYIKVTYHYLNIPIGSHSRMKLVKLRVNGKLKREFPVQLAEDTIGYWIFVNVSEFKGQTFSLSCMASQNTLNRIYQSDRIN